MAAVGYDSLLGQQQETIKIEVGLREPLLTPVISGRSADDLAQPASEQPMVAPVSVRCIDKSKAMAEKFRAALSRREPAIRDFFDIDHAVRKGGLQAERRSFSRW